MCMGLWYIRQQANFPMNCSKQPWRSVDRSVLLLGNRTLSDQVWGTDISSPSSGLILRNSKLIFFTLNFSHFVQTMNLLSPSVRVWDVWAVIMLYNTGITPYNSQTPEIIWKFQPQLQPVLWPQLSSPLFFLLNILNHFPFQFSMLNILLENLNHPITVGGSPAKDL